MLTTIVDHDDTRHSPIERVTREARFPSERGVADGLAVPYKRGVLPGRPRRRARSHACHIRAMTSGELPAATSRNPPGLCPIEKKAFSTTGSTRS
jgi:hypothetical protein